MSDDFAKCPCGTDDMLSVEIQRCDAPRQLRGDLYLVYCKWCGRGVPFVSVRYQEAVMPEAMAAWNAALTTRPTPEAQEAVVEQARALLDLDAAGKMAPHGIGGLAREVIESLIRITEARP